MLGVSFVSFPFFSDIFFRIQVVAYWREGLKDLRNSSNSAVHRNFYAESSNAKVCHLWGQAYGSLEFFHQKE